MDVIVVRRYDCSVRVGATHRALAHEKVAIVVHLWDKYKYIRARVAAEANKGLTFPPYILINHL